MALASLMSSVNPSVTCVQVYDVNADFVGLHFGLAFCSGRIPRDALSSNFWQLQSSFRKYTFLDSVLQFTLISRTTENVLPTRSFAKHKRNRIIEILALPRLGGHTHPHPLDKGRADWVEIQLSPLDPAYKSSWTGNALEMRVAASTQMLFPPGFINSWSLLLLYSE